MEPISPAGLPGFVAGYSHGYKAGNLVFVAGQVAVDEHGTLVGKGDIASQTRQVLDNVRKVLQAVDLDLKDVVSTTVYITDFENYDAYSKTYQEVFSGHAPARATVRADLVQPDFLIEIQAVAMHH
jgi:2-iminobutanoate/2-iminopropanoate deaminase